VCEQAHQQVKEDLGLDHFEGQSWQGFHRHALMTMIAYAFPQYRRLAQAGREKSRLRTASAELIGRIARSSMISRQAARTMSARLHQASMKPPMKRPMQRQITIILRKIRD
jgi:hypothetical protein